MTEPKEYKKTFKRSRKRVVFFDGFLYGENEVKKMAEITEKVEEKYSIKLPKRLYQTFNALKQDVSFPSWAISKLEDALIQEAEKNDKLNEILNK